MKKLLTGLFAVVAIFACAISARISPWGGDKCPEERERGVTMVTLNTRSSGVWKPLR